MDSLMGAVCTACNQEYTRCLEQGLNNEAEPVVA